MSDELSRELEMCREALREIAGSATSVWTARKAQATLDALSSERAKVEMRKLAMILLHARIDYCAQIKALSGGRAHHQGCDVGGLSTGMVADASGAPCWCGGTGLFSGATARES